MRKLTATKRPDENRARRTRNGEEKRGIIAAWTSQWAGLKTKRWAVKLIVTSGLIWTAVIQVGCGDLPLSLVTDPRPVCQDVGYREVPHISGVSPASIAAGSPDTQLLISGDNFIFMSQAHLTLLGEVSVFTRIEWQGPTGPGQLTGSNTLSGKDAVVPSALLVTPGSAGVSIANVCSGPTGAILAESDSNVFPLTITAPVAPTLTGVSPGSGARGQTAHITLTGTNFVSGATVTVSGSGVTPQNVVVVNGTTITADFIIDAAAATVARDVTVTTAGGSTTKPGAFSVTASSSSPLSILPATLPVGTVTKPYLPTTGTMDTTLQATGGTAPYKSWVLVNNPPGSTPPPGLTIDANTGVISGTPTSFGSFAFTAQVTDSTTPTALTATNTFGITIGSLVPHISTISPTTAVVNDPAFTTLTVNGTDFASGAVVKLGSTSLTTTFVDSTKLTAAITAADKATAGTMSVQVVNPLSVGGTISPETVNFTLTPSAPPPLAIIASPLPDGTIGLLYNTIVSATGGVPPYTWSAAGLPPALVISTNPDNTGTISGPTITRAGEFPVLVTVRDSVGGSDEKPFSLRVPCLYNTSAPSLPPNDNDKLKGTFAFRFSGFDATGHAVARVGSFVADGNVSRTTNNAFGSLTAGHEDFAQVTGSGALFNDEDLSLASPTTVASTYCIGNIQGRLEGTLTLRTATSTVTYAMTVSSGGILGGPTSASLIEFDPVDKVRGTGVVAEQANSVAILPGNYVFGFTGRDSLNGPASVAGVFNIDSTGTGTTGEDDFNDPGLTPTVVNNNPITASFQLSPVGNGRATGVILPPVNFNATGEIDFVAYAVHSYEFFALSRGSGGLSATQVPILSGEIFRQILPQPLDARNLNGSSIFYVQSANPASPQAGQASAATAGIVFFNGNANSPGPDGLITNLEFDADIAGAISGPVTTTAGTYTVASNGKARFTPAGVNFTSIAYLTDRNSGILLDPTSGAGLGRLFPHTFVLSTQPPLGITDMLGLFVDSDVSTGFMTPQTAATSAVPGTLTWNQDVNSPSSGLTFDFKSSGVPFTTLDSLNARFQVGTCGMLPHEICLIGYGHYGSLLTIGNILLDESGRTATPEIQFGASIPITPAPVAPTFASATSTTFTEGTSGLFRVTASGFPIPALSEAPNPDPLPSGVTFNPATGNLSGPPAAGTAGAYKIKFTASNGFPPDAVQNFTLNVNAPSATLAISTTSLAGSPATVGTPYNAAVSAAGGNPAYTWSETTATPLFDPVTGLGKAGACTGLKLDFTSTSLTLPITGTPTTRGTCGPFNVQIQDSSTPKQTANSVSLSITVN